MRLSVRMLRALSASLPSRVRDAPRLVRASGLVALLTTLWFAVNTVAPVGPPLLLWLPSPIAAGLLAAVFLRTSRVASIPVTARRFWRHLSVTATLVGFGALAQMYDVFTHPGVGGAHNPPAMMAIDGAAVLSVIIALYRLPLKQQKPGDMLRVGLDAATVMLAAAVFIWHYQNSLSTGPYDSQALIASMVLTVLVLAAVLAVAKVVLSSYDSIDKTALRMLAVALLVGAFGPLIQAFLTQPHLVSTQFVVPAVMFLAALAGERQRTAQPGPRRRGVQEPRRRPFSVLPYAAVAAVDGLLVTETWTNRVGDDRMLVAAAVGLTALVVLRQITAFRDNGRLLSQLDHGATHDALTRLPNRVLFAERLNKALTSPGDRPVSVALIDLDDFKVVNDTLGHEVGDLLLIAVARRLNGCVRIEDTVARLGGDEFVVVLDGADPAAADLAAERMITALDEPVLADGHELPIRASIGIADGYTGDEASVLLRHADIAMYQAKKLPGTACLHYDGGMAATVTDHAHLGAELRKALEADQLFLLYQPIVSLPSGHVVGAEALVRWAHPVRGTVPPDRFIPVAERTGLIVPLGRWVLREACRQLAAWITAYGDAAPTLLNVNISARDLREPNFAADVAAVLDEFGIQAERLVLEVTETMVVEAGVSISNLDMLRALGVRISLDDFGTGHSTLTLLHDCPVDEVKLDRSFVGDDLAERPTMALAVIQLARTLQLHAVAEGVETADQAEVLTALGYVAAQGYHFARPLPADEFGEILRDRRPLTPHPSLTEITA